MPAGQLGALGAQAQVRPLKRTAEADDDVEVGLEDSEFQQQLLEPAVDRTEVFIQLHRYLRAILYVLNLRTLLLCGFASSLVYMCIRWNIRFAINFDMVAVGTVFPLVFGVQQAYTRRERALHMISILKACVLALYFCHRDWDVSSDRATLGDDDAEHARFARTLIQRFLNSVYDYLTHPLTYDSLSEDRLLSKKRGSIMLHIKPETGRRSQDLARNSKQGAHGMGKASAGIFGRTSAGKAAGQSQAVPARLETMSTNDTLLLQCYEAISQLHIMNEKLSSKAGYAKGGEGAMSLLETYLKQCMEALENIRFLKEYRTPIMMRYTCTVMINVMIVMLAPYFAQLGSQMNSMWHTDWAKKGVPDTSCPAGYVSASLYVIICSSLYKVMVDLEYAFDQEGLDDVFFSLPTEFKETLALCHEQNCARREALAEAVSGKHSPSAAVWSQHLPSHLDDLEEIQVYHHYTVDPESGDVVPVCVRVTEVADPELASFSVDLVVNCEAAAGEGEEGIKGSPGSPPVPLKWLGSMEGGASKRLSKMSSLRRMPTAQQLAEAGGSSAGATGSGGSPRAGTAGAGAQDAVAAAAAEQQLRRAGIQPGRLSKRLTKRLAGGVLSAGATQRPHMSAAALASVFAGGVVRRLPSSLAHHLLPHRMQAHAAGGSFSGAPPGQGGLCGVRPGQRISGDDYTVGEHGPMEVRLDMAEMPASPMAQGASARAGAYATL